MSYLTETMNRFNVERHQVEQEASKQCAVVYLEDKPVFVSYSSVVGFLCQGTWFFTEEKHSVTTSQQVGAFHSSRTYLPESVFDAAMAGDAVNVIVKHEAAVEERKQLIDSFSHDYKEDMKDNELQLSTLHSAHLIKKLGVNLLNQLTREAKQELISELVDYEAGSEQTEKRYNKFKAKFNKAMKASH